MELKKNLPGINFLFLLIVLLLFVPFSNAQNDTINQNFDKSLKATETESVIKLVVTNTKAYPYAFQNIYLADPKNKLVYKGRTNKLGSCFFLVPANSTYIVGFDGDPNYKKIKIPGHAYLSMTNEFTYRPQNKNRKPVSSQGSSCKVNDTIWNNSNQNSTSVRTHANVQIKIRDHDENPVRHLKVFLRNCNKQIVYANSTNIKGIATFSLPLNNEYFIDFEDFQGFSSLILPHTPGYNLIREEYYAPYTVAEVNNNDTVVQQIQFNPKPTTSHALVKIQVFNHDRAPIPDYPLYFSGYKNKKVYLAISDDQGQASVYLPKGETFATNFNTGFDIDTLYYPLTPGFRSSEIDFIASGLKISKSKYEAIELSQSYTDSDGNWEDLLINSRLPASVTMEAYCPSVGDQEESGTCVGWAAAYYAYSITKAEAKAKSEAKSTTTNIESFSPSWVYEHIKDNYDNSCIMGSYIEDALILMKNKGNVSLANYPFQCNQQAYFSHESQANKNRINDCKRLFPTTAINNAKIYMIKLSLSKSRPVITGLKVVNSFTTCHELWSPQINESPYLHNGMHAITIIGYDDNKYDGAFRVVNSWGDDWGEKGYCWIRYEDFADYCVTAFEIY